MCNGTDCYLMAANRAGPSPKQGPLCVGIIGGKSGSGN